MPLSSALNSSKPSATSNKCQALKETDLDPSMVFGVHDHSDHSAKDKEATPAAGVPTAYTILLLIAVMIATTAHTEVFSHVMETVSVYGTTTLYRSPTTPPPLPAWPPLNATPGTPSASSVCAHG
jgi:hypothetical protein